MTSLFQDLRYAARTLRRSPGFTAAAVLTLMLGIGANTAIFSAVNAVLLRPLPYPHAERLVVLFGARGAEHRLLVSVPDIAAWRQRNHSFQDIGLQRTQSVNLTGTGAPDRLIGAFVDAHTLRILGATTALGRLFSDAEANDRTGAPVAVLSHDAWETRFGGDSAIIGKSLVLNGRPHVVIGVLSAAYHPAYRGVEVYLPITSAPTPAWLSRDDPEVWAFGRLRPGVTVDAARRDLSSIAAALAAEYPRTNAGLGAAVQPLRDVLVGPTRASLLIVLAAVGVVLLIACANVANLLLARAATRRREIALRAALGAGRWRIIRQLLTESVVIAVAGGAAGIVVAMWGTRALVAAVPGGLPVYGGAVGLDARVLVFSAVITLGAGLLFGAAPALFASRSGLAHSLRVRPGDAFAAGRVDLRSTFVGAQLVLCIVLLAGAGLLARSLRALTTVPMGFEADHVLTAEFRLPSNKYRTPAAIAGFMSRALGAVRAVPGVKSAALVRAVPLSGNWGSGAFIPDDQPGLDPAHAPVTQENGVSDGFFHTLGIRLLEGRDFDARDRAGAPLVAIVNGELARTTWPNASAIGRRVLLLDAPRRWVTVVGVVAGVRQLTIGLPAGPQLYVPEAQAPSLFTSVVARTDGDPDALAQALRAAIWSVDPDQPVWKVRSLGFLVTRDLAPPRFTVLLTAAFAVLAVLLAVVGVYGVMSYAVVQRTRELGIRVALGARRDQVVTLVLARGVRVVLVASVLGVAAALGAARLLSHQVFGVSPADPLTFAVAPFVLAVVALAACYLPARRAARVDPVIALASE